MQKRTRLLVGAITISLLVLAGLYAFRSKIFSNQITQVDELHCSATSWSKGVVLSVQVTNNATAAGPVLLNVKIRNTRADQVWISTGTRNPGFALDIRTPSGSKASMTVAGTRELSIIGERQDAPKTVQTDVDPGTEWTHSMDLATYFQFTSGIYKIAVLVEIDFPHSRGFHLSIDDVPITIR